MKKDTPYESREKGMFVIQLFLLIVFLTPAVIWIISLTSPEGFVTGNPGQESASQVSLIGGCVTLFMIVLVTVIAAGMMKARLEMKEYKRLISEQSNTPSVPATTPTSPVPSVRPLPPRVQRSPEHYEAYRRLEERRAAERKRDAQNALRRQARRDREELEEIRKIQDDRERHAAFQEFYRKQRERGGR